MRMDERAVWTVEEIAGDAAAVTSGGAGVRHVARRLLPPAARPGDLVRVTCADPEPGVRLVSLRVDAAARAALRARVAGALGRLRGRGGA